MSRERRADAVSPVLGVLLTVAVLMLLVAIIMAVLMLLPHLCYPFPPAVIQVAEVHDYDETGVVLNYDSRLLLRNTGTRRIPNAPLTAAFYADGVPVRCQLKTFHGEDFVPSHHFGIERIQGQGCRGNYWDAGAFVLIDFTDRTFMPGETIRVDIIDTGTGCIISSCYCYRNGAPSR